MFSMDGERALAFLATAGLISVLLNMLSSFW